MNGSQYVILAYALGLGLIWGYGVTLWLKSRATRGGKS
jgi:hypothetical protein